MQDMQFYLKRTKWPHPYPRTYNSELLNWQFHMKKQTCCSTVYYVPNTYVWNSKHMYIEWYSIRPQNMCPGSFKNMHCNSYAHLSFL